jgi:CubicO group peptidase (beta-lactamase class C family)
METLFADQPLYLPSGAVFLGPQGWFAARVGDLYTLEDPDHKIHMALTEVEEEDAASAARHAWRLFRPGFSRDLLSIEPLSDTDGWDKKFFLLYETMDSERRVVTARARLKDGRWYISLLDGDAATVDQRASQVRLVSFSFRAVGIEAESFMGKRAEPLSPEEWDAFAAFIEEARELSAVPGAAVAVVQGGAVVFERGFGVTRLGGDEKVTPRTLFAIGSVSKQLTTLMMARLVERGLFKWETKAIKLMPDFCLGDDKTTKRLTMRHTVSASTGLPRDDMGFYFRPRATTPEAVLRAMAYQQPTTAFGEVFQYSNLMVAAGGYIAAHASHPPMTLGEAYDLAMKEEVFVPLGMHDTTFDLRTAFGMPSAVPHATDLWGRVRPIPSSMENALLQPERPAGGVWSNLRDLGKVLWMELALGEAPGGGPYLPPKTLLARRAAQVKIDDRSHYALGLVVGMECDVPVVSHDGGTVGFVAHLFFLPEQGVGAVVLTNAATEEACFFFEAAHRRLLEVWFEGRPKALSDLRDGLAAKARRVMEEAARVEPRPDRDWVQGLSGAYVNQDLGRVVVREAEEGGILEAAQWEASFGRKLEKDGVVKLVVTTPPATGFEFQVGEKDGRPFLILELPQQRYVFEKVSV